VKALSRTWQMLLKAIPEVQTAARPVSAGEMALIRIAHAASLPTLDEALKMLDGDPSGPQGPGGRVSAPSAPQGGGATAMSQTRVGNGQGGGATMRLVERVEPSVQFDPAPQAAVEETVPIRNLADIGNLATQNRDMVFKTQLKNCVRLVRIEPGKLEISLTDDAPRDLVSQIDDRLKKWTGRRWIVVVSRERGGPTLAEQENERREATLSDARADPTVAAILAKFPGAKIIDIRIPDTPEAPDDALPAAVPDPGIDDDDL